MIGSVDDLRDYCFRLMRGQFSIISPVMILGTVLLTS